MQKYAPVKGNHKRIDLTFAKRLEQVMIERSLYPSEIARLTGIKRNVIYAYIQGIYQPTAYNIKRIAISLHVSADWLLGISDEYDIVKKTEQIIN